MIVRYFTILSKTGLEGQVTAKIEWPKKAGPGYISDFSLTGAGLEIRGSSGGIDEFQAVLGAFCDLRRELDKFGDEISFLHQACYTGIPRMVTLGDKIEIQKRIEDVLDNEHEKRQQELTAKRLASKINL